LRLRPLVPGTMSGHVLGANPAPFLQAVGRSKTTSHFVGGWPGWPIALGCSSPY